MRLNTVSKLLLIGGGAALAMAWRPRRHRAPIPSTPLIPPPDPNDWVQAIDTDELRRVDSLDLELELDAETEDDALAVLDAAELESTEDGEADEADAGGAKDAEELRRRRDTGELYGIHTPPAEDRELSAPEDQDGYQDADVGETWTEHLRATSSENGPTPERVVDPIDERDFEKGHPTDTRDVPIADKGSAGPSGL